MCGTPYISLQFCTLSFDTSDTVIKLISSGVPVENEASSVRPLQAILDYVDDQTGTCLHHATKVK